MHLIYLPSTTHWIAGDVPLKELLPLAKKLMFFIPCMYDLLLQQTLVVSPR